QVAANGSGDRAEGETDVRGETELEGPVPSELHGIAVDHDDARMVGERRRPPVAESEVERRAQYQYHVRPAEAEAASMRAREGLGATEAAAPGTMHDTGRADALREGGQTGSRVVPVDAPPCHEHGPLGAGEEASENLDGFRIGRRRAAMHVAG